MQQDIDNAIEQVYEWEKNLDRESTRMKMSMQERIEYTLARLYETYNTLRSSVQSHFKMCEDERRQLIKVLEDICRVDKTPPYGYSGDADIRRVVNWEGNMPPDGERWMTPREIANNILKDMRDSK